jgi:hypothetical protein
MFLSQTFACNQSREEYLVEIPFVLLLPCNQSREEYLV